MVSAPAHQIHHLGPVSLFVTNEGDAGLFFFDKIDRKGYIKSMIREELEKIIQNALEKLKNELGDFSIEQISLEHPENSEHGDYSTNIALIFGKQLKKNPQELAELVVKTINHKL